MDMFREGRGQAPKVSCGMISTGRIIPGMLKITWMQDITKSDARVTTLRSRMGQQRRLQGKYCSLERE